MMLLGNVFSLKYFNKRKKIPNQFWEIWDDSVEVYMKLTTNLKGNKENNKTVNKKHLDDCRCIQLN